MFNPHPIKSRVMKVINEKIAAAETVYKEKCIKIDEEAEAQKVAFADLMVNDIIGKFLK